MKKPNRFELVITRIKDIKSSRAYVEAQFTVDYGTENGVSFNAMQSAKAVLAMYDREIAQLKRLLPSAVAKGV